MILIAEDHPVLLLLHDSDPVRRHARLVERHSPPPLLSLALSFALSLALPLGQSEMLTVAVKKIGSDCMTARCNHLPGRLMSGALGAACAAM